MVDWRVTDPLSEDTAIAFDAQDPPFRAQFLIPDSPAGDGQRAVYLCGNSLGCQPRGVREALTKELDDWARLGVEGHHDARHPWLHYHELFREPGAALVGAVPGEVVMMNSLTANLHFLMASFYRPTSDRYRIVIEDDAFGSDSYAVRSQASFHGFDPDDAVVRLRAREGERTLRTEDIIETIERGASEIALVMLSGVNYLTGQLFDIRAITERARALGIVVGWDLAHAAGNVPLRLHDWGPDFAAWCSYKYLNSGPGATAGAFVHERHARDASLPRLAGWWGNDPSTRFEMAANFVPREGADGWQVSNPPIFAMTPLLVSLELFHEAGMDRLRAKALRLTGYLERVIDAICSEHPSSPITIVTPRDPEQRGCQLSLSVPSGVRPFYERLNRAGVIADVREPDVIRVAPVPLYNTFHDVWRFGMVLRDALAPA